VGTAVLGCPAERSEALGSPVAAFSLQGPSSSNVLIWRARWPPRFGVCREVQLTRASPNSSSLLQFFTTAGAEGLYRIGSMQVRSAGVDSLEQAQVLE